MSINVSKNQGFHVRKGQQLTACESMHRNPYSTDRRRGAILVLAAFLMVAILSFTAFTVDLAYISLTRTQLQVAADGSALAAGLELGDGFGENSISADTVLSAGAAAAQSVAAVHQNGDLDATYLNTSRDIRFGTLTWDDDTEAWVETWGASPYNLVEVTLNRGQNATFDIDSGVSMGDQQLPLLFGPAIGNSAASVSVSATAALLPAAGFSIPPDGGNIPIMPIAIDEASWDAAMDKIGSDLYSYDPNTGSVTSGSDGIVELNIFPDGDAELPPGNRGTVSFGDPSDNSTSTLERQIIEGLNAYDMSFYTNNEISLNGGPFEVYGNPGISAGIEDELISVIGQFRIAALFSTSVGTGSKTTYTVVRWVGIRIMAVDLNATPKHLYVQPTSFVIKNASRVKGGAFAEIRDDTIFAPVYLYK